MTLVWTKTLPTKAGWYWEWNFGSWRVVEVFEELGNLWVIYPHRSNPMLVSEAFAEDTYFSGPIDQPEGFA